MATPQITLTCTLNDLNGQPVNRGTVTIVLFGFGAALPMVAGTAMLAKIGPVAYSLADGTFATGLKLWGNDQISPPGTYYAITIEDEKKNVVQTGIYQFTGSETIDLSNAPQVVPGIGTPPLQYVTADVWIILPGMSGQLLADMGDLVDQLTRLGYAPPARPKPIPTAALLPPGFRSLSASPGNTYVLTRTPYGGKIIALFYNGSLLIPTLHYSISGLTITLTFSTSLGDNLLASYVATTVN